MSKGRIEDADFAAETVQSFEGPSLTASKHGDVSASECIETEYPNCYFSRNIKNVSST